MEQVKKFISKSLIIGLPVIIGVILVNYFGDGARLFDNDYEKSMANIVLGGQNVTNISNFDERLFQKELIKGKEDKLDQLVIGSSRTMLISQKLFPEQSFFNSSVTGAGVEDLVAIVELYKSHNRLPEKLLLGLDPWTLNSNNNQNRWVSIASYLGSYVEREIDTLEIEIPVVNKYTQLVSLSYFQSSLMQLPKVILGNHAPVATPVEENKTNTKLNDGSLSYSENFRNMTLEKRKKLVAERISKGIYSIENFEATSIVYASLLKNLLEFLIEEGVEVTLLLVPYNPSVFPKIEKDYPQVIASEEFFRELANEFGLRILGSFNPESQGLRVEHFFDEMHCTREGMNLLLKQY